MILVNMKETNIIAQCFLRMLIQMIFAVMQKGVKMSDLISRQDAIDYLMAKANHEGAYGYINAKEVHDYLSELPSAETEIIHCYDCVHYTGKGHPWGTCKIHRGSVTNRLCQEIDYCSWAERRTDG